MGELFCVALVMLMLFCLNDNRVVYFFLSLLWITVLMLMFYCPDSAFHSHPPWEQGVETGHNGMLVYTAVGTVEYISIGFVLRDGKVEKEQQEAI